MSKSKPPSPTGFEEAPQAPLEGSPADLGATPVADWVDEVAREAKRPAKKKAAKTKGDEKPLKTARGTSMGGKASAKDRAASGLMPVAGLDVSLEDAEAVLAAARETSGVTATVSALEQLIEEGRP